jgi:hypothetical protein
LLQLCSVCRGAPIGDCPLSPAQDVLRLCLAGAVPPKPPRLGEPRQHSAPPPPAAGPFCFKFSSNSGPDFLTSPSSSAQFEGTSAAPLRLPTCLCLQPDPIAVAGRLRRDRRCRARSTLSPLVSRSIALLTRKRCQPRGGRPNRTPRSLASPCSGRGPLLGTRSTLSAYYRGPLFPWSEASHGE